MARRVKSLKSLKSQCFKAWGKMILARDRKCIICNAKKAVHPHHIFPRSRYLHLQFDLRNGVGLCAGCHLKAHHDPVRPVLRIQAHKGEAFGPLVMDALTGKRKNPYKRKELDNILTALTASGGQS